MQTFFAPAERATQSEIEAARQAFSKLDYSQVMLDAIPDWAVALNRHRQIVGAGAPLLRLLGIECVEDALGLRPGEAVGCIHSNECPGGCGTSAACAQCGAVNAILECLESRTTVERECRIMTRGSADGGALDLRVRASYLEVEGEPFVLLALRDISAEKRREILERAVVNNLHGGLISIHQLAQLVRDDERLAPEESGCVNELLVMARGVLDEVRTYRMLLEAERNELTVRMQDVYVPELITSLADTYHSAWLGKEREIALGPVAQCIVSVDLPLAMRALANLIENALEATPSGGTVTLTAREHDGSVEIEVHNEEVIPNEVQVQIFLRSFTTKPSTGRGIGTYSTRLYVERYLGGRVSFTSFEPAGTTFRVTLPARSATTT